MNSETPAGAAGRRGVLGVCLAITALTVLDISKITVALPAIQSSLQATPAELQLTVVGFGLTFGLALIPAGRFGDLRGRRGVAIAGLMFFLLASLGASFVGDATALVVWRMVQGIGAGMIIPQVYGTIQQEFTGRPRALAYGLIGAVMSASTAVAPALAGMVIVMAGPELGWRLLFAVNVPFAMLVAVFVWRVFDTQRTVSKSRGLDLVGLLILGSGTVALMFPFIVDPAHLLSAPIRWVAVPAGVALMAGFVVWERRYARRGLTPTVDVRLFRLRSFRNGAVVASLFFGAMPPSLVAVTLFLQSGLGYSPLVAGLTILPLACASALAAWASGRLVWRYGRRLVTGGLVVAVLGCALTQITGIFTPSELLPWAMTATLVLLGIGAGLTVSPNQSLMVTEVPRSLGGLAGAIGQLGQRMSSVVGIAATTGVFFACIATPVVTGNDGAYRIAFATAMCVPLALLICALMCSLADGRSGATPFGIVRPVQPNV